MKSRKELKRKARSSLKKHWLVYVALCVFAAFCHMEFSEPFTVTFKQTAASAEGVPATREGGMDTRFHQPQLSDVLSEAFRGNYEKSRENAREIEAKAAEAAKEGKKSKILGRSRGVLAMVVNGVTSGKFLVTVLAAINSLVGTQEITLAVLIILSLLLAFLVWFFFLNMFIVVSRRIFLEGRIYERLPVKRVIFLLRVKKWCKVSCTMFVTTVFGLLWDLTIIGGMIKTYSYFLVPYIAAENPDVSPLEAITLSRKMMKGHKWECFLLNLSYFGWYVLGQLTCGITAILYSDAYKVAAFCEYYAQIRQEAIEKKIPGYELLNDPYLFEKADQETISRAYEGVLQWTEDVEKPDGRKGISRFLADFFGIAWMSRGEGQKYQNWQIRKAKSRDYREEAEGKIYPGKLFSIPEEKKWKAAETMHYLRCYSVWSLILMFFIFSFVGWLWEVSLHLITDGVFVNRGVLHGPWLPIYGSGSVLILLVLNKFRSKPVLEFGSIVVLCGCVEYFTSLYLELTHGEKWWDYSGYFLNLNGRICAEGLLVFGIGGMAIVYVAAPLVDELLKKLPLQILVVVSGLLLGFYITDQCYSSKYPNTGAGITDYTEACLEEERTDKVQQM